jgi:hypothetical protein
MQRLRKVGSCNAFIREPISTKEMSDGVQSAHPKMLSCCFVVMTSSKRSNVQIKFRDMMEESSGHRHCLSISRLLYSMTTRGGWDRPHASTLVS